MDTPGLELRRVRDRELQLKRITGEISCAECRRLKLKCDKKVVKVPCSSCTRRGCRHICPTGVNKDASGKVSRNSTPSRSIPSVANEDDTAQKLRAMSERIRMLEDALQIECGQLHPLLAPEKLAVKQGIIASNDMQDEDPEADEMRNAFGALTIDENKAMRYLGAPAVEQSLLIDVYDPMAHQLKQNPGLVSLPLDIIQASNMWPFVPMYLTKEAHAVQLASFLPPYQRASALVEAFFGNLSWFMSSVERSHVQNELMPIFYKNFKPVPATSLNLSHIHDLALLYAVFSSGSIADLTHPVVNAEGLRYHQLAKAALGIHSVLEYASLSAIQALVQIGTFSIYLCDKNFHESCYKSLSLAILLASSIGLHRDPARWKLDARTVERRRRVFWELFGHDQWKTMMTGRPPQFTSDMVDCEYPNDNGATIDDEGNTVESVWHWKYRYSRDVLSHVVTKLCRARPLKYSEVMELDRLIQDFKVHPYVHNPPKNMNNDFSGDFRFLHPQISVWWREGTIHGLHRNYFARALLEYPNDPMACPFAPSFLATYKTSLALIKIVRGGYKAAPLLMLRTWIVWSRALSCSVIVALTAIRCKNITFAREAFLELKRSLELFERVNLHPAIKHGTAMLRRLYNKAAAIHNNQRQDVAQASSPSSDEQSPAMPIIRGELDDAEEELLILRGTTRLVHQRYADSSGSKPLPLTVPGSPILNYPEPNLYSMDATPERMSKTSNYKAFQNDRSNVEGADTSTTLNLTDFFNSKTSMDQGGKSGSPSASTQSGQSHDSSRELNNIFSQANLWLAEANQAHFDTMDSDGQTRTFFESGVQFQPFQDNGQPYSEQVWHQDPSLLHTGSSAGTSFQASSPENGRTNYSSNGEYEFGTAASPYDGHSESRSGSSRGTSQDASSPNPPNTSPSPPSILDAFSLFQADSVTTNDTWHSLLQQTGVQGIQDTVPVLENWANFVS